MHKSRLGALVIDCRSDDLSEATEFWSRALGYDVGVEPDDDEGKYAKLEVPPGEVSVILQQVEHPSRVHLDIETDDLEAEAARLEKLGAKRVAAIKRWIVMEAPSGHRFCIVNPQRFDFADGAKAWHSD
jgi:predicted enzyme related to lactoylglutathione lyase